jgi:hypothetical protein
MPGGSDFFVSHKDAKARRRWFAAEWPLFPFIAATCRNGRRVRPLRGKRDIFVSLCETNIVDTCGIPLRFPERA